MNNIEDQEVASEIVAEVRKHRWLYIFEAILLIILGILAITIPGLFTLATEMFIGWMFILVGLVTGYRAIQSRSAPGFWPSLFSSLVSLVLGVLLLVYPLQGVITLTILLAIFFLLQGIAQLVYAIQLKPINAWGWFFVSGLINLAMAAIIWYGWPSTAIWVIGLLVGINFLMFGFTLLFLMMSVKKVA